MGPKTSSSTSRKYVLEQIGYQQNGSTLDSSIAWWILCQKPDKWQGMQLHFTRYILWNVSTDFWQSIHQAIKESSVLLFCWYPIWCGWWWAQGMHYLFWKSISSINYSFSATAGLLLSVFISVITDTSPYIFCSEMINILCKSYWFFLEGALWHIAGNSIILQKDVFFCKCNWMDFSFWPRETSLCACVVTL